jgi:hypothetical protein
LHLFVRITDEDLPRGDKMMVLYSERFTAVSNNLGGELREQGPVHYVIQPVGAGGEWQNPGEFQLASSLNAL